MLVALVALAAWTRWSFLHEGFWRDEAMAIYVSQSSSPGEFFERNRIADYNPPLFNVLLASFGRVFGFDETPLKTFAFLWGLAAVLAVALAARALFESNLAAAAAGILAVDNPILISVSSDLRGYSLSVVLAGASIAVALAVEGRAPRRGRWWLLAVLLALLGYSHVAGVLVFAALGISALVSLACRRYRAWGVSVGSAAALAGLTFLVWLPSSWRQFRVGLPYETRLAPATRLHLLAGHLRDVLPLWPLIVAVFALGVVLWRLRRAALPEGRLFAPIVLAACAAMVFVPLGLFSQTPRYWTIAAALMAVLAGGALSFAWREANRRRTFVRAAAGAAIGAVLAGSFLVRLPTYAELRRLDAAGVPKSGIRTLCRDGIVKPGEPLIVAPDYLASTAWYYCGSEQRIHGFVRWKNPVLLDLRTYAQEWSSKSAVSDEVRLLTTFLADRQQSRFALISDREWDAPPLFFGRKVAALQRSVEDRYGRETSRSYVGRLEKVDFTEFQSSP